VELAGLGEAASVDPRAPGRQRIGLSAGVAADRAGGEYPLIDGATAGEAAGPVEGLRPEAWLPPDGADCAI